MKYKLLAIDLDGTLLKRHRKITKNNFKALKAFNDDTVTISFVEEFKPIIIPSLKDEGLIQLILPLRAY